MRGETSRRLLLGVVLVACGQDAPPSEPVQADPAPPPPSTMAAMSAESRPPPAPAVIDDDTLARLQSLHSEMRGGGGGPPSEFAQHFQDMPPERAYALAKQLVAAGRAADPGDACARVMAMYDVVAANNPHAMPQSRQEVLERCRREPRAYTACLKAESERSPSERRRCARMLERDPFGSATPPDATMEIGVEPPDAEALLRDLRRRQERLRQRSSMR